MESLEGSADDFRERKSKDKRPLLFLSPKFKPNWPLNAIELQKLLGLCFMPQHYKQWPKWVILKRPLLVKSVALIEYDGFPGNISDYSFSFSDKL
ncbi:hypothetical protein TcWFU_010053 [Taenia crassiceps]|uniref:Uncharacterized protein n=1 Tax=Taenia crassiceps TaxID=6207 RepID=A0ABR4Q377_9CEST